tara:strand:+ start:540 stop:704 length:165 start_codon:yes stop_codon:yes gene_type:complete
MSEESITMEMMVKLQNIRAYIVNGVFQPEWYNDIMNDLHAVMDWLSEIKEVVQE